MAVNDQIILLPQAGYWDWVQAVKDYAVKFGVQITPLPENAMNHNRPNQTVTIINPPGGYPKQGDIQVWFKGNAPDVRLDVINASDVAGVAQLLAKRIADDDRFGTQVQPPAPTPPPSDPEPAPGPTIPEGGFVLHWPTDFDYVTQKFGENPQFYAKFGLPAHEGLDIRAPLNANIYACADGEVYRAERDETQSAYGLHVRIKHAGGYKTIYGHMIEVLVNNGDFVKAGQVIGLADSTGNSTGHHLHLTLKKDGATAAGLTNYPWDIIDPTPYLMPKDQSTRPEPPKEEKPVWGHDECLVGVHGRADGPMEEADWQVTRTANVEALKLLSWARPEDIDRAREINPNIFILMRLMFGFGQNKISPEQFAETVGKDMEPHYKRGVRYFEVHNEPNLAIEGWGTSWRDGSAFAAFWLKAVEILKAQYPEARWGWPGCSPGSAIQGQRFHMWSFIEGAREALEAADWLGIHCYWQGVDNRNVLTPQTGLEYLALRDRYPDKLLFITEFSNSSQNVDKAIKASQYLLYYEHLRHQPGVGAAFSFVVSSSRYFAHEAWRSEGGKPSAIPGAIGARPKWPKPLG